MRLSRRQFLFITAASATVPWLPACRGRSVDPLTAWQAWEEMRAAARRSPDHLAARAAALVRSKDVAGLHALVRDRVTTYPSTRFGWRGAETEQRWGWQGTLRGSAGTPREKAELLVELYRRAGFDGRVVLTPTPRDTSLLTQRRPPVAFKPDLSAERERELLTVFGVTKKAKAEPTDQGGAKSRAIATTVLTATRNPKATERFDPAMPRELPNVVVQVDGQDLLVDLWTAGSTLAAVAPGTSDAREAATPHRIGVALEVCTTDSPHKPVPLVEHEWGVEQLVGGRICACFVPAVTSFRALLNTPPRTVTAFVPTLTAQRDASTPITKDDVATGGVVTISGDVLADGKGVDGAPLAGSGDPTRVVTMRAQANASAFPEVTLLVDPRDSAGAVIEDLPATAFMVTEAGVRVGVVVRRSHIQSPRVLFLLDDSSSIPEMFRRQEAGRLVRQVSQQLFEDTPDAVASVATISLGKAQPKTGWTNDLDILERAPARAFGLGSQLWEAVAHARALKPTLIVLVSDGAATDDHDQPITAPPAPSAAAVRTGAPVLVLGVGPVDEKGAAALAAAGRGLVLSAQDTATAAAAITQALPAVAAPPYELRYTAPLGGGDQRTVTVWIGNATTTAKYSVPPADQRATPAAITAILVRVRSEGRTVTRVLAGRVAERADELISAQVVADVREAMFGSYVVGVEAAAPSDAQVFDDVLATRLAAKPLIEARASKDEKRIVDALQAYRPIGPAHLFSLAVPLSVPAAGPVTFEFGPRLTVFGQRTFTRAGKGQQVSWADVLPLTRFVTATADPARAFTLTAERSARLALAEAALFSDTTISRLGTAPLAHGTSFSDVLPEHRARVYGRLAESWRPVRPIWVVPTTETAPAAWAIDPGTGTLWGVIADPVGAGGGADVNEINRVFDDASRILDLVAAAPGGNFAFGVWISLEQTKLEKLRVATIMLATMEAPEGDITDLSDLACDVATSGAMAGAGAGAGHFVDDAGGEFLEDALDRIGTWDSWSGAAGGPTISGYVCGS